MMQTVKQGKLSGGGTTANCNCFAGTAYHDATGNCGCHPNASIPAYPFHGTIAQQNAWRNKYIYAASAAPPPGTGGVKPPVGMKWTPNGWVPISGVMVDAPPPVPMTVSNVKGANATTTVAGADDDENTIFGFSPWVVLGAAAVGLWFLSSMDTKGKK